MKIQLQRVIDDDGRLLPGRSDPDIDPDALRNILVQMYRVRWLDERMMRLQRQGRIGFALAATGEEATHIGPTHALRPTDWIYPCYREIGAALYRGYSLRTFLCQMFGNAEDPVMGRQMPVHHSIRELNYVSISSPVGTQIPQAVGIAMAARRQGRDDVALVYFGDGATSTGAFHVACNQAAVDKAPCIFLCRNNGWAISVPRALQTASATLAQKAVAYGMPGILVDGNDVLALIAATQEAAARGRQGQGPTLIEARTYRRGAHSSSDDPSVYRDPDESEGWTRHDPITRFRAYLTGRGLWSESDEQTARVAFDTEFAQAMDEVAQVPARPPLPTLFEDVFAQTPWHLREQRDDLLAQPPTSQES